MAHFPQFIICPTGSFFCGFLSYFHLCLHFGCWFRWLILQWKEKSRLAVHSIDSLLHYRMHWFFGNSVCRKHVKSLNFERNEDRMVIEGDQPSYPCGTHSNWLLQNLFRVRKVLQQIVFRQNQDILIASQIAKESQAQDKLGSKSKMIFGASTLQDT